ncbi:MAG: CoA transferase [Chloroflexi bacterium]|nr:CoA transferase [Chloroflexota bacterium]
MAGVLEGVKVVSMEHWYVMPMASVLMSDWGASVIKVEPPAGEASRGIARLGGVSMSMKLGGVEVNPQQQFMNRNKKSMVLDLKKEAGRHILCQLIQKADVFMSNYELGAIEKLKLDYDTMNQLNPRLIYAIVTGFGSKGPDKDKRAFDVVAAWARSGMGYLMTAPGQNPPGPPQGMGDRNASVHLVAGILGALLQREKTGKGQKVECSLYQSALWIVSAEIQHALSGTSGSMGRGPRTKAANPLANYYGTKDDRWLQFYMPQSDLSWADFCRAIEMPELEQDPRFNNMEKRRDNNEELIRILDEVFASKTMEEWDKILREYDFIYSPFQSPKDVVNDPQALANDFFKELHHPAGTMKVLASPVSFSQDPASVRAPAPETGQHTEEVLLELGYSWEDIAGLKETKVIP